MSSLPEPAASTIERVEVYGYELTYAHGSYVMSEGRAVDGLPSTIVRVVTVDGLAGYGEVCPLGTRYLPAFAEGARAALREIGPALIGVDAANLGAVGNAMDGALLGHAYAKSPVDIACWDILGRRAGLPLYALLGGLRAASFPLYVAVPLGAGRRDGPVRRRADGRGRPPLPAQARRRSARRRGPGRRGGPAPRRPRAS